MTKFTRLVVIHGSDQNDQFRVGDPSARVWLRPIHIVAKYFGPKQFFQLSGILDKTGNIRGFKAEHIGISLCDYPGLVFAKVSLCEILATRFLGSTLSPSQMINFTGRSNAYKSR